MHVFDCECEWRFVVGDDRVYGPIFRGPGEHKDYFSRGRLMTREEFEDDYADCAYRYELTERAALPVHPFTD